MREDCFAYEETNGIARCNALKKIYCKKGICNFYKTREQLNEEVEKCNERLEKLEGRVKKVLLKALKKNI